MPDETQSDDASIADDDEIWRRIPPSQIIFDENLGRHRPTSNAFKSSSSGHPLSVYVAKLVTESGRTAESILEQWPEYSMAALSVGALRRRGLGIRVEIDPAYPEEEAHAVVLGRTRGPSKKLCKEATWVVLREKKTS